MKGLKSFIAAATILLAAGCAEDLDQAQDFVGSSVTFTASIDEALTKTVMDYDRKLSMWSGNEYISILNGQENYTFKASVPEPASETKFALADEKTYSASDVVAMYPCSGDYALDKDNMTVSGVVVLANQYPVAGTYDALSSVMVAYTTNEELNFKNAVSLIRFKVKDTGIWNVTFKASAGEKMSGAYSLRWNDGEPEFVPVEGENKQQDYVSLGNGAEGESTFAVGEYYYIAVVPGTYSQGFTVIMNNVEARVTGESKELKRNTVYDLGELVLPTPEAWGICGTMTDWGNGDDPIADLALLPEGDWLVYKGLAISFIDRFQFRADNEWGRQYGYNGLAKSGETYEFAEEDRSDIYVWEPGVYDVYLATDFTSFKIDKVGDLEGKPAARNWGVAGDMTGWGVGDEPMADIAMTAEGSLYVAKDVTIYAGKGFKFRLDNSWDVNLGRVPAAEGQTLSPVASRYPYELAVGGGDIIISESGVYDIYLSAYEDGFRVIRTGDAAPEPEPEPEPENMTVYFRPSTSWTEGSVTLVAWVWATGSEGAWYGMTDSDSDGIYEVTFPGNLDNIIFTSMNGAADWANKVYKTDDLKVPVDDKNAYVVYDCTWKTLAEAKAFEEPEQPQGPTHCRLIVRVTKSIDWYDKYIYSWTNGTMTGNWPGTKMLWLKEDGNYYVYYHDFSASLNGKEIDYIINGGNGSGQTKDLKVTLDGEETTVTIETSHKK